MGMSLDRAIRLQSEFLQSAQDVMSNCIYFKLTHDDILEHLNARIFSRPEWKKVPAYVQAYINGWLRCKYDSIYLQHLIWMKSVDGNLLTTKEMYELCNKESIPFEVANSAEGYKTPWARCDTDLCRHVWKDENGNPLVNKPYDRRFQKGK